MSASGIPHNHWEGKINNFKEKEICCCPHPCVGCGMKKNPIPVTFDCRNTWTKTRAGTLYIIIH